MHKSQIFLFLCLAFLIGSFIGRFVNIYIVAVTAAFFIMLVSVWWERRGVRIIGFLGLVLAFGSFWFLQSGKILEAENFIGRYYEKEVVLEGIVARDPDVREEKTNLTVEPLEIIDNNNYNDNKIEGKILVNAGRYPEYSYGDKLKISGQLEEPFESEEFSYKNYLARYDVYALMRYPEIEKLGENQGHPAKAALLAVKHKFQDTLSRILPEPHNAFVLGLILGLKKAIPEDLNEILIITGISHIVVISGYNISILTRNLLHTRFVWGRIAAFWLSLAAVLAFVVLTGAEASVVRAAIMGMILVLALNVRRMYYVVGALAFAAAVMVFANPKIIAFDAGFQLSFLATAGLVYLAPVFDKWLYRIPDFLSFRTNLSSTLAAQIFTLPVLIYYFDRMSLVAPLVNVLILWVIPYAMLFGFLTGLAGMVSAPLAQPFAAIVWALLEYLMWTARLFAAVPFAAVGISLGFTAVLAYYALLWFGVRFYRRRKKIMDYMEFQDVANL